MKNFWISWYNPGTTFALASPWWVSGYSGDAATICAAVRAEDKAAAEEIVYRAMDERPGSIAFRFVEERPSDWSPYNGRFRRAEWMPEWIPLAVTGTPGGADAAD